MRGKVKYGPKNPRVQPGRRESSRLRPSLVFPHTESVSLIRRARNVGRDKKDCCSAAHCDDSAYHGCAVAPVPDPVSCREISNLLSWRGLFCRSREEPPFHRLACCDPDRCLFARCGRDVDQNPMTNLSFLRLSPLPRFACRHARARTSARF